MSLRGRWAEAVAAVATVAMLAAVAAGPAAAGPQIAAAPATAVGAETSTERQFRWLCRPGRANDPCVGEPGSLRTLTVNARGRTVSSTPRDLNALRSRIDCFYVYPTVSGQPGPNADLSEDPEIRGIAAQQAARFTPGCRMFAPIYRQFTVPAILGSEITPPVARTAYASVKAAWREYLTRHNRGRGIVLIGHSQGTGHLAQLIAETFDRRPNLRKRLVSAVLVGGNVVVPKGRRTGGSFDRVPSCAKATDNGCVIAYSGFLADPPPEDALFGRLGGALTQPGFDPATHEVMCVNPARLDGSRGALRPVYETAPFPGIYGPLLPDFTGYRAPRVGFPGLYRAACAKAEGASWLRVVDVSGPADPRPRIGEPLGRTWGTHLTEVNDATGNLVRVVTRQSRTWVKKAERARRARLRKKVRQRAARRTPARQGAFRR